MAKSRARLCGALRRDDDKRILRPIHLVHVKVLDHSGLKRQKMMQTILQFLLFLTALLGPETESRWGSYPSCSEKCFSDALQKSGCDDSGIVCLCANSRLLARASACALPACSVEDFDQTFSILNSDCTVANQSIQFDLSDFTLLGVVFIDDDADDQTATQNLGLRAINASPSSTTAPAVSKPSTSTTPLSYASPSSTTTSSVAQTSPSTGQNSQTSTSISSLSHDSKSTTSASSTPSTPLTSSPLPSTSISTISASTSSSSNLPTPTLSIPPSPRTSSSLLQTSPNNIQSLQTLAFTSPLSHDPTSTPSAPSTSISTISSTPTSTSTNLPTLTLSTSTTRPPDPTFIPSSTDSSLQPIVSCSDPSWHLTPQNWISQNVDLHLQQTRSQWGPNVGSFLSFVANFSGVDGLNCGVGTAGTCTLPTCPQFKQAGAEPWQYLVAVAVVQMNTLFNVLHDGISTGKEDLTLVIIAMANDFYEWKDPTTTTQRALPWITAILTSVLTFLPILLPLSLGARSFTGGVGQVAAAFAQGGLQTLAANSSPETFLLSNMETIGLFIKEIATNSTIALEIFSKTLYAGEEDPTGKTIIDYFANGRFSFPYDIQGTDVETFFFQSVVSDVVNDQLVSHSKTFVMCGDGNVPCTEASHFSENGKSCCLYRLADNNTYIEPPEITTLKSPKYDNINSSSVVASSLRTYFLQGLMPNQSDTTAYVNSSLSSNLNNQSFFQGPSAPGIWTLPVCDVGSHSDWVASYSSLKMPCCCGPSCSETVDFFQKAHLAGSNTVNQICKTQYPAFVPVNGGARLGAEYEGMIYVSLALMVFGVLW